mmetsp:Transcript_14848/g.44273  ORF Transcript_14848/g.44273 Transcript_14848/m.44273 type:complete len:201 (+) Transcript_14848:286-888(+)
MGNLSSLSAASVPSETCGSACTSFEKSTTDSLAGRGRASSPTIVSARARLGAAPPRAFQNETAGPRTCGVDGASPRFAPEATPDGRPSRRRARRRRREAWSEARRSRYAIWPPQTFFGWRQEDQSLFRKRERPKRSSKQKVSARAWSDAPRGASLSANIFLRTQSRTTAANIEHTRPRCRSDRARRFCSWRRARRAGASS